MELSSIFFSHCEKINIFDVNAVSYLNKYNEKCIFVSQQMYCEQYFKVLDFMHENQITNIVCSQLVANLILAPSTTHQLIKNDLYPNIFVNFSDSHLATHKIEHMGQIEHVQIANWQTLVTVAAQYPEKVYIKNHFQIKTIFNNIDLVTLLAGNKHDALYQAFCKRILPFF